MGELVNASQVAELVAGVELFGALDERVLRHAVARWAQRVVPKGTTIFVQEELLDGVLEDKMFAPGYGEFAARVPSEDELVRVAIGAPTDALLGPAPHELGELAGGAARTFAAVKAGDWARISSLAESVAAAWAASSVYATWWNFS